jgi:hypothetical protein
MSERIQKMVRSSENHPNEQRGEQKPREVQTETVRKLGLTAATGANTKR